MKKLLLLITAIALFINVKGQEDVIRPSQGNVFLDSIIASGGATFGDTVKAPYFNATSLYYLAGVELGSINDVLWVDGDYSGGLTGTGSVNVPYTTISLALTASVSGDIIFVAPGTYSETVTFTSDSITLVSIGGPEVTFIDVTMSSSAGIHVVDYTTIIGFTITETSGSAGALIELNAGETNVRLFNNTLDLSGTATFGISVGASGSDSLFVQNNKFRSGAADGCIWMQKTNTATVIDNNEFFGVDSTSGYAIQTAGINIGQFTNNIINGYYASGIFVHTVTSGTAGAYNVVIDGNLIKNCSKGIRLGHASQTVNMDSIWVTNNTIYHSTTGIYIADDATVLANTFDILDNRLFNNTTNYTNDHSSLIPRSFSNWLDGDAIINGTLDQTIPNTVAGGEIGINTQISHTTNALTGDLIGVRGNARVNVASPSGSAIGGKFQAGNMSAGFNMSTVRGVYSEVVNKIPSGATTWTNARAFEANMDLNQGSAGNVNTITNAYMFYGVYNLPTVGTYATVTNGYGVFLRNEQVGGNGQMLDAGFYLDDLNMGGAVKGWDYGIDFSGIGGGSGSFGTADLRLANGALINNSTASLLTITEATTDINGDLTLTTTATNHLVLPLNDDAATPTLAFGDGNTGFYEEVDNVLKLSIAGSARFDFRTSFMGSTDANGGLLINEAVSTTNPTLVPDRADMDTGIGGTAGDTGVLSFIANGTQTAQVTTTSLNLLSGNLIWTNGSDIQNDETDTLTLTENVIKIDGDLFVTGNTVLSYGEMFMYESAGTQVVDQVDQYYGVHGVFEVGLCDGWSFVAGSVGLGNITTAGGGSAINIADVGHGLVTGDYVAVQSANHTGREQVTRIDDDNFTVPITFVGNEASTWQEGDYLLAGVNAAGTYKLSASATYAAGAAAKEFHFEPVLNDTDVDKASFASTTAGNNHDGAAATCLITIAAGDRVWFIFQNETDATNMAYEHANINLHKL